MLIPARHTRRSVRMRGHDYACAGAYFLTLVCNERRRLFGEITSSGAILNRIGNVVDAEWTATAEIRKEVQLGPHILMPNHLHAIVFLIKANDRHDHGTPSSVSAAHAKGPPKKSVASLVAGFKAATTKRLRADGLISPATSLWQRSFYEHVVRDDDDKAAIEDYIADNPRRWLEDRENPAFEAAIGELNPPR